MKTLVVVAHPDDEILGAGGTIFKKIENGESVGICMMNKSDDTRYFGRPEQLEKDFENSCERCGFDKVYLGDFPNLSFNVVPHIELVRFIEGAIKDFEPDIVITHSPSDANIDHIHTSIACQEAVRYGQRGRYLSNVVREFYYMEVPSATDWGLDTTKRRFNPNTFFEIGESEIRKKIVELKNYENVIRDIPHPRSEEAIKASAVVRGAQAGFKYAEAFECVFRRC